jgi:hypothetical protein
VKSGLLGLLVFFTIVWNGNAQTDSARFPSGHDSLPFHRPISYSVITRDSLELFDYQNLSDLPHIFTNTFQYSLGSYLHPTFLSRAGAGQNQSSLSLDGLVMNDRFTGAPGFDQLPSEDARDILVYPMHESFYHGGNGALLAMDYRRSDSILTHPVTRLRHAESSYDYLATDAVFAVSPTDHNTLYVGLNRTAIGSSQQNIARYPNERSEGLNIRLRFSEHVSSRFNYETSVQLYDYLTLFNGGVAGTLSGGEVFLYPATTTFAASAFDPKAASLVNTTIMAHERVVTATATSRYDWAGSDAHQTMVRLSFTRAFREYWDNLQNLHSDTIDFPSLNYYRVTDLPEISVRHTSQFGRFSAEIFGNASGMTARSARPFVDTSFLSFAAGSKWSLDIPTFRFSAFARFERSLSDNSFGIGGNAEFSVTQDFGMWVGLSHSTRNRSMYEKLLDRSTAQVIGQPNDALQDLTTAEFGLKHQSDVSDINFTIFHYRSMAPLTIFTRTVTDTLPGRYSLLYDYTGSVTNATGASLSAQFHYWNLYSETNMTYASIVSSHVPVFFPKLSVTSSLYYRGVLIEGALDLKIGGSVTYSDSYLPPLYNPLINAYTAPEPLGAVYNGAAEYTKATLLDLFVYATVKKRATIHLLLHNLLNTNYITTQFYPMSDLAVRLGVTWVIFDSSILLIDKFSLELF